ncbi:MAG TPA: VOC family protein [Mucilaginibacter sp.]|jgi:catechol 2,3-dioxygenase-like lactoylglutathione lyase family enzyme
MRKSVNRALWVFAILFITTAPFCSAQIQNREPGAQLYLKRFDHVGINIRDLQKSEDWYKQVFGFKILHKWKTTWMIGNSKMKIGLFQRPNGVKIDSLDNTVAITHFAFLTDSAGFKKIQAFLKMKNIPFDPPEDTGIAYSIFIYDPDHHQIEITTYHTKLPDSTAKQ